MPLSRRAYRVYKALEFYARMGSCHPSEKALAHRLKLSVATIERAIRELRETLWISVERRPNTSSIYTLLGQPRVDGSGKSQKSRLFMRMEFNLMGPDRKRDGSGDGSGDGSIPYIPEASESRPPQPKPAATRPASQNFSTPAPKTSPGPERDWTAYEARLKALARRACPGASALELPLIMHRLEDLGVMQLPEGSPLPKDLLESGAKPPRPQFLRRKPPARELPDLETLRRRLGEWPE